MAFKSTELIGRQVVDAEGTPVGDCHEVWISSDWRATDVQIEFERAYAKKMGLSVPFMGYLIVRLEPQHLEIDSGEIRIGLNPAELREYIDEMSGEPE